MQIRLIHLVPSFAGHSERFQVRADVARIVYASEHAPDLILQRPKVRLQPFVSAGCDDLRRPISFRLGLHNANLPKLAAYAH
jgi:hypothetical protein